ncbi:MAG: MFS transporter [Gammaproteobacteria bacterium]|mgnify:FL=1|nr:MFS transporter [Gammaproteobacteria bacterium]|tara:strand:+ start:1014 stop:2204 length:1191 start_codon:yes stop_codon:yes gene_type:complete
MSISGSSWLKFGLFTVGLGQSFVFVLVPPLARDLGLSVIQTSSIFAISAFAWALTSAFWGRTSDKYGRRNIAILGLLGYAISLIALITPLFLVERNILHVAYLFPALVLGRLINGLVGSATRPASFAYVADTSTKEKRTLKFARLESSFLLGTVAGPLLGGFLFLITNETPFYVFSFFALVAAFGIYRELDNTNIKKENNNEQTKINWYSKTILPFLIYAAILSLCQASLLQSIGFYITDLFNTFENLPTLISMTFALLSISTIVSQYIFTDAFPMKNFNLLLFGTVLLIFSYSTMAFFQSISVYYLSIIILGFGFGMTRPALASSLSLAQTPENQGSAAGYLGSVIPIGHMTTPFIAMPIYAINPAYLYYFSSILCIGLVLFIIFHPTIRKSGLI